MSQQKLTVVVTCTDRKRAAAPPALMVRNLPSGTAKERVQMWRRRLRKDHSKTPLMELYGGETWSQVKCLIDTARLTGRDLDLFVASAGLGLRRLDEAAPAYAATFSMGKQDSVARSLIDARIWWAGLPRAEIPPPPQPSLWILSEAYSRVMATDISANVSDNALVFGGSSDVAQNHRVPSNRSLRKSLGGTVMSLNVRMAIQWLRLAENEPLLSNRARQRWNDWCRREQHIERYERQSLSDGNVRDFIAALVANEPGVAKTRALKALRGSGFACEQHRFSILFGEVAGQ